MNVKNNDFEALKYEYSIFKMSMQYSKLIIEFSKMVRDMKPDNILLDEFLFPRIADFGLSKTTISTSESMNRILTI